MREDRRVMFSWVKSHSSVTSSQQSRWLNHKQSGNKFSSSYRSSPYMDSTSMRRQGVEGREQWGAECTKVIDLRRRNRTKRCCNCSRSAQSINQPYTIGSTNLTTKKLKLVWRINLINVTVGLMILVMWQTNSKCWKFQNSNVS